MREGTVLSGKYRLVSLLGEGGMGAVWRAEDLSLGSAPVAIKLMHARDADDGDMRNRFEAEARISARLRSPHVVQVFDIGVDAHSDVPFIAMELLEGETLYQRLRRAGSLAPQEVAQILAHVAAALGRAHEIGIVHRDLKPANIFLVQSPELELAKVLDFGVAKRASQSWRKGPTATGDLLGTPVYMSPEQILSSKDVDQRADLWSLAVIAVECMTGQVPFDADNLPGLALQITQGQAVPPSRLGPVPPGLDRWFARATERRPDARFSSAAEMIDELRQVCDGYRAPARSGPAKDDAARRSTLARTSLRAERSDSFSESARAQHLGVSAAAAAQQRRGASVAALSRTFRGRLDPRRWRALRVAALAAVLTALGGFLVWVWQRPEAPQLSSVVAGAQPLRSLPEPKDAAPVPHTSSPAPPQAPLVEPVPSVLPLEAASAPASKEASSSPPIAGDPPVRAPSLPAAVPAALRVAGSGSAAVRSGVSGTARPAAPSATTRSLPPKPPAPKPPSAAAPASGGVINPYGER